MENCSTIKMQITRYVQWSKLTSLYSARDIFQKQLKNSIKSIQVITIFKHVCRTFCCCNLHIRVLFSSVTCQRRIRLNRRDMILLQSLLLRDHLSFSFFLKFFLPRLLESHSPLPHTGGGHRRPRKGFLQGDS